MHEFRSALLTGDLRNNQGPVAKKERCRRNPGLTTLAEIAIARAERRQTNQRREDRFHGAVERATILFRRKKSLVRVVNISAGGLMIESNIMPRIGETVMIEFEGFDRIEATVRWIKQGRIGLDVGEDSIDIG